MMIAWLVLTGRLDVSGPSQDEMPFGLFCGSALLAGLELGCEMYWIFRVTGAL